MQSAPRFGVIGTKRDEATLRWKAFPAGGSFYARACSVSTKQATTTL